MLNETPVSKTVVFGENMRSTTKWSIGLAIAWLILNIIANASAPSHLPGFDGNEQAKYVSEINTANFFQSIGSLCLLAAIVCVCITVYRNVMDKSVSKTIYGPSLENSPGSNVATGSGIIASGRAVVAAYGANIFINKGDEINKNLDAIEGVLKQLQISEDEKRRGRLIVGSLRRDAENPSENKDESIYNIKDLAKIFEGAGNISSVVKVAIDNLTTIFGINA